MPPQHHTHTKSRFDSLLSKLVAGFTILGIILAGAWGADQKWEDEPFFAQSLAQYAKKEHKHESIRKDLSIQSKQQRIYSYQDDLADIQDKRDSGASLTILDVSKERRLKTNIQNIKDEIKNLQR